jgi:hypothetical protein
MPEVGEIIRIGMALFRVVRVNPDGTYISAMIGYGIELWSDYR